MVLRDVAVVSVLLSIFAAAESWATVSRLGFATLLSVVDGLLVGAATTAITGASKVSQVVQNFEALDVIPLITPEIRAEIEAAVG